MPNLVHPALAWKSMVAQLIGKAGITLSTFCAGFYGNTVCSGQEL